jgi:hypothetical protein
VPARLMPLTRRISVIETDASVQQRSDVLRQTAREYFQHALLGNRARDGHTFEGQVVVEAGDQLVHVPVNLLVGETPPDRTMPESPLCSDLTPAHTKCRIAHRACCSGGRRDRSASVMYCHGPALSEIGAASE